VKPVAQGRIDRARKAGEVLFGFLDRGFGGGTDALAVFCRLGDQFEVALQRAGVPDGNQARAGATAGGEQWASDAQQSRHGEAQEAGWQAVAHGH
jgi:hypothetical protein